MRASCAIEGWKDVTKFHSTDRRRCHGMVAGCRLARASIRNPRFEKDVTREALGIASLLRSTSPKDVTGRAWVFVAQAPPAASKLQKMSQTQSCRRKW